MKETIYLDELLMGHPDKVFSVVQDDLLQLCCRELVAHGPLLAVVVDERDLRSISPTCLRAVFTCVDPIVQNSQWLDCHFCAFGIYGHKSCSSNVDEIDTWLMAQSLRIWISLRRYGSIFYLLLINIKISFKIVNKGWNLQDFLPSHILKI